ncbi:MAG: T9SS type A sorting domain-containing protein, partial [Gammaproteobacteria bacterium]|nr:T9SS type A sorting domain-containing protein [Gammaproteobacteria bacterium]
TTATGAPFDIVLPITVANGSIDGEATTITITAGSIESELLTVIPTPGTSDAVTVDIGTLPELPTSHFGYSLSKPSAADNTLSFALGIPKPTGDPKVNHAPVFTEGSSTTRSIAENTPAGKNIGSPVSATDLDEDVLTYTLSGADAASFGIVSTTGQLQTRDPLDYEKKNTYAVTVTVSDGSATDAISVTIDVTDVEENNNPVFVEGTATEREIPENTPAGKNIGSPVSATDLDEEDVLTYSLSGADAASFGIVSTTGQLQTRAPLDYEQKDTYSVAVLVSDGNGGTDSIGVAINVTDVEENNAPVFVEGSATERSIPENTPAGRNIGAPVSATDLDEDVLTYSLSGVDATSFGIVSATGQLRTRAPLDYEQKNVYSVAVLVSDGNGGTASIGVAINVTDVNETPTAHAPEFIEGNATERAIAENTPAGRNIGAPVTATDEDEDVLTYTLSGVDAASFGIVSTTGQLQTRAPLDYEQKNTYSVAVIVSDGTLTDTIGVAINVTDVAENNAPVYASSSTERSIPENTPAGRNIGSPITATDADGDSLTYALDGTDASSFGIVSTTGQLKTSAPLDYEEKNAYAVTVIASDGTHTDTISVAIKITDLEENTPPVFAGGSSTTRSIPENTPAGVHIGEAISAKDADTGDTLTYTLRGTDAAAFDIDSTTGQLKTKAALDYETKNTYSVTVRASDSILIDTIRVIIVITDIDEGSGPAFAGNRTTRFVKENTPPGQNVGSPVSATDEDDDTLTYTLSGTDAAAFSIVSTTGQLKTRAPLDFETKNAYTVTVTVFDGGRTDAITVAITISDVDETPPTTDESPQPSKVGGKVSISEVMYGSEKFFSPKQWIEIFNSGTEPVDLLGWTLTIQNVASDDLTGPVTATINFRDARFDDAPKIWPSDFLLIVTNDTGNKYNSGGFMEDQVYDLRWREGLGIGFNTIWLSAKGFRLTLTDKDGNLVDEAGNYDGSKTLWDLPYHFNRGRTRAGNRTSLIRRYVNGLPLDGTQVGSWITAAEANLTDEQRTYYGDRDDISTPGIGIVINEISTQFVEYDVNKDGVVNISDLVMVAGRLGQAGPNIADVNRDGFVNVQDLILVAGVLGEIQAAPSLHPTSLETFTAADVRGWLTQAQGLALTDPKLQRGIRFLEQLLSVLVPKETQLLPNYPNPFNPETWIPYRLAEDAFVTLTIYDQRGRVIRRLNVGHKAAAVYERRSKAIYWNGRNEVGDKVASGIYFYTLTAGDFSATRKMLILK